MSKTLYVLVSAIFLFGLGLSNARAAERPFAVIAAPGATDNHLSRESIAQIFKRKQNYWENGTKIQPVNLPPAHPVRRSFSQSILGHPPEALEDYWREMYFHGVLPPHVLASEEAVVLFVSSTPGAIGYVANCLPEHRVSVVLVVGDIPVCPR
jgi:ABC-type phosphate transport system substrate-binding protein